MAKRSNKKQSDHDREVQKQANIYKRKGWNVEADIPGYDKPSNIAKKIPDLKVKKGSSTRIIEVETPETINKDRKQHETFRRHAGQKRGTKFILIKTKK